MRRDQNVTVAEYEGTVKPIKGTDLEMVEKAPKPATEPSFVPDRGIIDVWY